MIFSGLVLLKVGYQDIRDLLVVEMFAVQREDRWCENPAECPLGPGSYSSEKYGAITKQKPIAGGFGRGERRLDPAISSDAGPGTYEVASSLLGGGSTAPFKSTTDRIFETLHSDSPGPGSYLRPKYLEKAPKKPPIIEKEAAVSWERVMTAPSIPTRKQRFGYDEGETGDLVLQESAIRGYDGDRENAAGPADYEPKITYTKAASRTVDFGKTEGHRFIKESKSALDLEQERLRGLPPGAQFCSEIFRQPTPETSWRATDGGGPTKDGKPRKSAAFSSTTVRRATPATTELSACCTASGVVDTPGPGAYTHDRKLSEPQQKQQQQFGSKAPRFASSRNVERRDQVPVDEGRSSLTRPGHYFDGGPGPGSYNLAPRRRRSQKRYIVVPRSADGEAVGFDSTATRFREQRMQRTGPGSYDVPTLVDEIAKKVTARSGAFGTSTRRFPQTEAVSDGSGRAQRFFDTRKDRRGSSFNAPRASKQQSLIWTSAQCAAGVVSEGKVPKQQRMPSCRSSFFASSTGRSPAERQATVPPPGAYDVAVDWNKAKGVAKLFSGAKLRIAPDPKSTSESLGPGSYNLPPTIKKATPSRKKLMVSSASRFPPASEHHRDEDMPGPGSYDYQLPYGNLLKPTYNVAIAAESRDLFY